ITISLLDHRPSMKNFFNSTRLQEWTRATNVRLRLLRTKNLLGHLMSMADQDPTTTRRYFYSIKDISIGGRCRCNGHADVCDILDPEDPYHRICRCQHNTCGHNCEVCCPGYEQKAWRQSQSNKPFSCERFILYSKEYFNELEDVWMSGWDETINLCMVGLTSICRKHNT
ncbi:laminin subunit alpha-like, partial [Diaphorina citri]|uniref:Laminin subunit alpha-like n=1 Tax=Diaphorina citri TaxID=121845 RepID=A0A1S3DF54_DIACI